MDDRLKEGDLLICSPVPNKNLYYHYACFHSGKIVDFNVPSCGEAEPGTIDSLFKCKKYAGINIYDDVNQFEDMGHMVVAIRRYFPDYVSKEDEIEMKLQKSLFEPPKYNLLSMNCEHFAKYLSLIDYDGMKEYEGCEFDQITCYKSKFLKYRVPPYSRCEILDYQDNMKRLCYSYRLFLQSLTTFSKGLRAALNSDKLEMACCPHCLMKEFSDY